MTTPPRLLEGRFRYENDGPDGMWMTLRVYRVYTDIWTGEMTYAGRVRSYQTASRSGGMGTRWQAQPPKNAEPKGPFMTREDAAKALL